MSIPFMAGIHIVSRIFKMFSALNKEYITYHSELMIKLLPLQAGLSILKIDIK